MVANENGEETPIDIDANGIAYEGRLVGEEYSHVQVGVCQLVRVRALLRACLVLHLCSCRDVILCVILSLGFVFISTCVCIGISMCLVLEGCASMYVSTFAYVYF